MIDAGKRAAGPCPDSDPYHPIPLVSIVGMLSEVSRREAIGPLLRKQRVTNWVPSGGPKSGRSLFFIWGALERETGFEPATLCLGSRCSTTELLPQARTERASSIAPSMPSGWLHRTRR